MTAQHCEAFRSSIHGGAELYRFEDYEPQPDDPHIGTIYKQLVTLVKENGSPASADLMFIQASCREPAEAHGRWTCTYGDGNQADDSVKQESGVDAGSMPAVLCKDGPSSWLKHKNSRRCSPRAHVQRHSPTQVVLGATEQTSCAKSSTSCQRSGETREEATLQSENSSMCLLQSQPQRVCVGQSIEYDLLREIAILASTPIEDTSRHHDNRGVSQRISPKLQLASGYPEVASKSCSSSRVSASTEATGAPAEPANKYLQQPATPELYPRADSQQGRTSFKSKKLPPVVPGRFFTLTRKSSRSSPIDRCQKSAAELSSAANDQGSIDNGHSEGGFKYLPQSSCTDMYRDSCHRAQSFDNLLADSSGSSSMLLPEGSGSIEFRLSHDGEDDGEATAEDRREAFGGKQSRHSSPFLAADDDKMSDTICNYRNSSHSSQLSRSPQAYSPKLPSAPRNVRLTVASETSLCVRFDCGSIVCNAAALQYKVEWSTDPSFQTLCGSLVLSHRSHTTEADIHDLDQGVAYHVRVITISEHGCSKPAPTEPTFARPSSWREVQGVKSRTRGQLAKLNKLQESYKLIRPQLMDMTASPNNSPTHTRKVLSARRGIKSLFAPAIKFHKNLKRGLYLACLFYNEDRVLVTSDEVLPIVEVDDGYPSGIGGGSALADFLWLVKVSCSWDVVRDLRQSVSKLAASSGALDLRLKMLQAAGQLQAALGVHDLGQMFYKPLRCSADIAVLVAINYVRDTKSVSSSSVKWLPLTKLHRHSLVSSSDGGCDDGNVEPEAVHADVVMQRLQEAICYHRVSSFPLSKGLYLGFLKATFSVDDVKLLVSEQAPNVLPHVKLRSQPHVSKAEWQWLRSAATLSTTQNDMEEARRFKKLVTRGVDHLLESLGVSKEDAMAYRLHTAEVLEFSSEVSFIIMMPPRDQLCSVQINEPQSSVSMRKSNLFYIPLKVFETIHLSTYMASYLHSYSQMACRVDMDTLLSQQSLRQAFSSEELEAARRRVREVGYYQQQLEAIWQSVQWITDVLTRGREKKPNCTESKDLTFGSLLLADGGVRAHPRGAAGQVSPSESKQALSHRSSDCDTDTGYHSDRSEPAVSAEQQLQPQPRSISFNSNASSTRDERPPRTAVLNDSLLSGQDSKDSVVDGTDYARVLRVYAAYDSGMARGTKALVRATSRTTAREVVDFVVEQLEQAVVLHKPSYAVQCNTVDSSCFCLAVVIGCRERVLRDDYALLQLMEPWVKGRLYVRRKDDVLAAVEHECAALSS